jgi:hypothetical protein
MSAVRMTISALLLALSTLRSAAAPPVVNQTPWIGRSMVLQVATQACRRCKGRCDAMYNQE